jgi:hypothetical protein
MRILLPPDPRQRFTRPFADRSPHGEPSMDTSRASAQSIVLLPTTVSQTPRPDVVPFAAA